MKKQHRVTTSEANIRIDKLLTTLEPEYSRQQIQQWIKSGNVFVDQQRVKANYLCNEEEQIVWMIPEKDSYIIEAEPIALDILYEDEHLLVVHKPKGMLVHPTKQINTGTLVHGLLHHCEILSNVAGEERPGIVHRLDKDTSGLLLVAKDNETHVGLQQQFMNQSVTRLYECIVDGIIEPNQGLIRAPIGRNPRNRLQRMVMEGGQYAETKFNVLQRFTHHTHVQCALVTGRTHQIRVHMSYMNHPIVGDGMYNDQPSPLATSQLLFAQTLQFVHPQTNEKMSFTLDTPAYFQNVIQLLTRKP